MNLAEYQRAVLRVSFEHEPSEHDLALLGDATRFRMYRHMVRTRLLGMAKVAYKGTLTLVGEEAFAACFARFLAERPPASRLIRDVVHAFGEFALDDSMLFVEAPAHARDVLGFEQAKWGVAYQAAVLPRLGDEGLREVDFEGRPVLNPVLRVLRLAHPVHLTSVDGPVPKPTTLLVYRPPASDEIRWWSPGQLFGALVEHVRAHPESPLVESLRAAANEFGRALDATLLEELAGELTLAVERGVLLGVR